MFGKQQLAAACVAGVALAFSTPALAINVELVTVGNPGNAADATGFGRVNEAYLIGKYEVTNAQWRGFLTAKASLGDPYGLYNANMAGTYGGIARSGLGTVGNPYVYTAKGDDANWDDRPVNYVSFWDTVRFCNWLHNGQNNGDTEGGAYINIGNQTTFSRQAGARYYLPNENEWYKAAYHKNDGATGNYFDYPTASDTAPSNTVFTPDPGNHANFRRFNPLPPVYTIGAPYYATAVGEFENSTSAYGTFDQGGNVWEWNETAMPMASRGLRGGGWETDADFLIAGYRDPGGDPAFEGRDVGFRVAAVPEPGSVALLLCGSVAGLAWWLWRREHTMPRWNSKISSLDSQTAYGRLFRKCTSSVSFPVGPRGRSSVIGGGSPFFHLIVGRPGCPQVHGGGALVSLNKTPLVVAVILCLSSQPALGDSGIFGTSGSLMLEDWKVAGDHMIVKDTATGYRWLNLTKTTGLSYNQVVQRTERNGVFEGFAVAHGSDVKTLFDAAGITIGSNVPRAPITDLLAKWGAISHYPSERPPGGGSSFLTADSYTDMNYSPPVIFQRGGELQDAGISQAYTYAHYGVDPTVGSSDIATALFQPSPVPEPSTFILLGMGAVGLLAYAWRRRRAAAGIVTTSILLASVAGVAQANVFNMGGTRNADGTWNGLASLETVRVGDRNNPPPTSGYGAVGYDYQIGKYEVTDAQYCEFLNAKAAADTYGLYNTSMATDGGIIRAGSAGSYSYTIRSGYANKPVGLVSWYDTVRFANWLTNGQGNGSTETGSYTITSGGYNAGTVTVPSAAQRAAWASGSKTYWLLTSEDEWKKAGYYDPNKPGGAGYWLYPTRSDSTPYSIAPPGNSASEPSNTANYRNDDGLANGYNDGYAVPGPEYFTDVGAYSSSPGSYGTFDQGGNAWEWTEAWLSSQRENVGGSYASPAGTMQLSYRGTAGANAEYRNLGFRVVSIVPEPSTFVLLGMGAAGLLGLAWRRRRRAIAIVSACKPPYRVVAA